MIRRSQQSKQKPGKGKKVRTFVHKTRSKEFNQEIKCSWRQNRQTTRSLHNNAEMLQIYLCSAMNNSKGFTDI